MSIIDSISGKRGRNKGAQERHNKAAKVFEDYRRRTTLVFFDSAASVDRQIPEYYHGIENYDGLRHLNISLAAQTEVGQALDPDYNLNWEHPLFGTFHSLTAFSYFIMTERQDDRLRSMRSTELNNMFRRDNEQILTRPANYEFLMVEAAWHRLNYFEALKELVVKSKLPFDMYRQSRMGNRVTRVNDGQWFVPAMEILRFAAQAKLSPDLSTFVRDAEVNSTQILLDRPTIGVSQEQRQALRRTLEGERKVAMPPKPNKVAPSVKQQAQKAAPKPKEATRPPTRRELLEQVARELEDSALGTHTATVWFETRQEALQFMFGATAKLMNNPDGELDVSHTGIVTDAESGTRFPGRHPVHIVATPSGSVMRLGDVQMASPFMEEAMEQLEIGEKATPEEILSIVAPGSSNVFWRASGPWFPRKPDPRPKAEEPAQASEQVAEEVVPNELVPEEEVTEQSPD